LISPAVIAQGIPSCVDMFRVQEAHFYGPSGDGGISVRTVDDNGEYVDHGVTGARRSAIHLRPSLEIRQHWYKRTEVLQLFVVETVPATAGLTFVFQFLLDVRTTSEIPQRFA